MVLPGTVAFVVFRDEIGDDAASALPVMIERLMPPGLLGLMTVGFVLFLADTGVFGGVEWISDPRRGLGIPFMIQAFLMFCLWSVVFAGISLATPAPDPEQVEGITWPNPLSVIFYGRLRGWHDPRLLTIALLVLMAALYYVFR